uniref:Nuclear pore complex protein n=1 Tax=Albugo laibachii Nc14 TaxID=890382 RepID=F0WV74_9STRA|nr:conserved hypothetical protein [Albugo laibachii Nc14]|eukprot:CCA25313.1 conserved hypothetical protein [Albugo laibachii Nc14]
MYILAIVGEAKSRRLRPEATFLANLLADFHQTAPEAEDQKSFCDKLFCGYIDVLDAQIKRMKVKQGRGSADAFWNPTLSMRSSQEFSTSKAMQSAADIKQLMDERNTWKLLYQLRQADVMLESLDSISAKMSSIDLGSALHIGMTEDQAVELLESHNTTFRVLRAVKDWLEDLAAEEELPNLEKRKGIAPRTLRSLKQGTYLGLPCSKSECHTIHLDPDATLRAGDAPFVDDDLEDEALLMKCLWKCVRSGQLEKAIDVGIERGQTWRAANLCGGTLVGALPELDASTSRWGNPFRPLWKSICWRFSNLDTPGKMVKSNTDKPPKLIHENRTKFVSFSRGVLSPTHCFQHVHSAQQVDFILHGLAVDVVYTLQQGVKALNNAVILELADLQLELTEDASVLWLKKGRHVRRKHVNCHVGKWSVEAMRRHVVKKQKHVPIFRAHSFIEAGSPVLEQLGCHPAFWSAAVVDAKLGSALPSETPWLAAHSGEEQRKLERAVCVARNGNCYALIYVLSS